MFTKFIAAAAIVTVTATATAALADAPKLGVGFDMTARTAGNGYSAAQPNRAVLQPRGILKTTGTAATGASKPRASFTKFSNSFAKQPTAIDTLKRGQKAQNTRVNARMQSPAGKQASRAISSNRDTLRHRGDVARHARKNAKVTKTLQTKAISKTPARTIKAGQVAQQKRIVARTPASTVKAGKVARNTRKGVKAAKIARTTTKVAKTTTKVAKTAKKLKGVRTLVAGGAGVLVAETVLGTDLPDAVDVAMWTVNTLKDPKNAPKAIAKLGKDTVKKVGEIGKTLTNPKKMANNAVNGVKSVANTTVKVAKAISKPKQTVKKIGKAVSKLKFW